MPSLPAVRWRQPCPDSDCRDGPPATGEANGIGRGTLDRDVLVQATALAGLITVEEAAAAVGFLASPLVPTIAGANLPVDAGYLAATSRHAYGGLRPIGN